MERLRAYRDDGVIADELSKRLSTPRLPALTLALAGVTALGVGLLLVGSFGDGAGFVGTAAFLGSGILSAGAKPGRLQWLVPPLLRAGEYGVALWLASRAGPAAFGLTYGLLAAVAFHQYDIVYRLRHQGVGPPRWLTRLGGGWEGRATVLTIAGAAGIYQPLAAAMALWLAAVYVSESVRSWIAVDRAEARGIAMTENAKGN
ncbi:MAG: DUF5941 domain-containing protein [Egibacteraceae bacterium]